MMKHQEKDGEIRGSKDMVIDMGWSCCNFYCTKLKRKEEIPPPNRHCSIQSRMKTSCQEEEVKLRLLLFSRPETSNWILLFSFFHSCLWAFIVIYSHTNNKMYVTTLFTLSSKLFLIKGTASVFLCRCLHVFVTLCSKHMKEQGRWQLFWSCKVKNTDF